MPAATSFYPRVFALVVAAVLGYALVLIFVPFLGPLAWAAFLAFLLYPLNLRLRRRSLAKGTAAGVLTFLAPIVILLPLSALSIAFFQQISALTQKVQKSAAELDIKSLSDLQQFPWIARINVWLEAHAGFSAEQIQSWLVSGTREVLQRAASLGGGFFLGALGSLLGFAIMLFLLFFFLRDGDGMLTRARRLIPLDELHKERLFRQLGGVTRAIVVGTSMTALMAGVLIGIGFKIAGLPSPVVFGVLAALLSMLPVGGAAFVWGPAAIWLFIYGRWGYGIFMVAWGLLLTGLDNIVRPMLISGRAKISTLAVFIGVLGGIPAFGSIGVIAGPVVLSLALALVEFAEESRSRIS
ncbi:MAG TPA: AI-2E family transporter [Steroidobacteraceae bacterium]|jgi:predicted PurR-regulated permease PerM|nr:AI-2E family transporter [Steroidobacteraceae bacterium]